MSGRRATLRKVPPCLDVYVWVTTDDRSAVLRRFIDRYVDTEQPREPRFSAFKRTFVTDDPQLGDSDALAELQRNDEAPGGAFSIYLHGKTYHEAIITLTAEGDLVLGLGLDHPDNAPETEHQAATLMAHLREEFGAVAGVGGVGLAPPQSVSEWRQDEMVQLRDGFL